MREIDALISEYQHDKRRPRETEALTTLRKVASLAKPIMRQRGWRVGTLAEFYPAKHLLGLNINHGEKICLRLRYSSDERQFLPLDQVLDTFLHELCHIVIGPHNEQFNALWNQLRDEHTHLTLKGYTGEGFLSEGKRLGGHRVPMHEARRQARAAAEKRRTLTAGSGRKVGGAPVLRGTDMRKVIADAAQRRITVTKGCASGTSEGEQLAEDVSKNGFKTKAEEDDANERAIMQAYIEMIQEEEREQYGDSYSPPSAVNPAGPRSSQSPPPIPTHTKPVSDLAPRQTLSDKISIDIRSEDESSSEPWTCPVCTLVNPETFLCCDACTSERPQPAKPAGSADTPTKCPSAQPTQSHLTKNPRKRPNSAVSALMGLERSVAKAPIGWSCHSCGAFMEANWWTCSACGTMKLSS